MPSGNVTRLPVAFHSHHGRFDPEDVQAAWRHGFGMGFVTSAALVTFLYLLLGY